MAAIYPQPIVLRAQVGDVPGNLLYLEEHGLVKCISHRTFDGVVVGNATITAKGLDFLADDGGLTAILGVVDVRLHADSIKALMATRIDASDLPTEQKSQLREQLRNLPGSVLTHLTNKLVDLGMQNVPAAIDLIQKAIGQV
jgi:hypothetical protein